MGQNCNLGSYTLSPPQTNLSYLANFESTVRNESQDVIVPATFEEIDADVNAATAEVGLAGFDAGSEVSGLVVGEGHVRAIDDDGS